jgi:arsenate reductase
VLNELGIETGELRSKGVEEFLGRLPVRYLIVVCGEADQKCPTVWPGMGDRLFWPFPDPASAEGSEEQRLQVFRDVRDEIDDRIKDWLAELRRAGELSASISA